MFLVWRNGHLDLVYLLVSDQSEVSLYEHAFVFSFCHVSLIVYFKMRE